ncbi:hypothetical protein EV361DRAFT_570714 [Lentinula raphanica]|nr:hypothetical protein EV361DRAFT_570714 [Lentinula raphanica]
MRSFGMIIVFRESFGAVFGALNSSHVTVKRMRPEKAKALMPTRTLLAQVFNSFSSLFPPSFLAGRGIIAYYILLEEALKFMRFVLICLLPILAFVVDAAPGSFPSRANRQDASDTASKAVKSSDVSDSSNGPLLFTNVIASSLSLIYHKYSSPFTPFPTISTKASLEPER